MCLKGDTAFDRTVPTAKKDVVASTPKRTVASVTAANEHHGVDVDPIVRDRVAERLFDDIADKELNAQQQQESFVDEQDDEEVRTDDCESSSARARQSSVLSLQVKFGVH